MSSIGKMRKVEEKRRNAKQVCSGLEFKKYHLPIDEALVIFISVYTESLIFPNIISLTHTTL